MRPLTRRQHDLLVFISGHIATNGYAPSFTEIAAALGLRSLATVHEHLGHLERKGWIRRRYNEARALELMPPPDSDYARGFADARRLAAVICSDVIRTRVTGDPVATYWSEVATRRILDMTEGQAA